MPGRCQTECYEKPVGVESCMVLLVTVSQNAGRLPKETLRNSGGRVGDVSPNFALLLNRIISHHDSSGGHSGYWIFTSEERQVPLVCGTHVSGQQLDVARILSYPSVLEHVSCITLSDCRARILSFAVTADLLRCLYCSTSSSSLRRV